MINDESNRGVTMIVEVAADRIKYLEDHIGYKVKGNWLDPFSFNSKDIIEIQKAGKKIAAFLSIESYKFIISRGHLDPKSAGRIELDGTYEIWIEIQTDSTQEEILGILSHEITHKFMQLNFIGIGYDNPDVQSNELLTDITMIYIGLGKLVMNCVCSALEEKYVNGQKVPTKQMGYLKPDEYCMLYLLVCKMRRIPAVDYMRGLHPSAVREVVKYESAHLDAASLDNYGSGVYQAKTSDDMASQVREAQGLLARIEKQLIHLKVHGIKVIDQALTAAHKDIKKLQDRLNAFDKQDNLSPLQKYLETINIRPALTGKLENINKTSRILADHLHVLYHVLEYMGEPFKTADEEAFKAITCRNDNTELKVPSSGTFGRVRCPGCDYSFYVDTGRIPIDDTFKLLLEKILPYGKSKIDWKVIYLVDRIMNRCGSTILDRDMDVILDKLVSACVPQMDPDFKDVMVQIMRFHGQHMDPGFKKEFDKFMKGKKIKKLLQTKEAR